MGHDLGMKSKVHPIVGPRLRARHPKSQQAEALMPCNILNRMEGLGMPKSLAMEV